MMATRDTSIDEILDRNTMIARRANDEILPEAASLADRLLDDGERILEIWLDAHGEIPSGDAVEGFRLLGLHRQAARGVPSFNACRETCREIVFHRNAALAAISGAERAGLIRRGAMVVVHLALFIGGKLEVAGLGEFCCSSRPLRQADHFNSGPRVP